MSIIDDLNDRFEKAMLAGKWAGYLYRLAHAAWRARLPILPYLIQMLNGWLHGCEIHYKARIGRGLQIAHPRGIVVGQKIQAGDNLKLFTGVVLGVKHTGVPIQPVIGHNVTIYAGAKVLGGVTVGDNAVIGANSVVTRDVEPGAFVTGIPARLIGRCDPVTGKRIKVVRWRPGLPGGMGDRVMAQCLARHPRIKKPADTSSDAR